MFEKFETMSQEEITNCIDYAMRVLDYYKLRNHGSVPASPQEAALAIREYNREHKPFETMYEK